MELAEARKVASEKSGGTSSSAIKDLIVRTLESESAKGDLVDYGAGLGELLGRLATPKRFDRLAGIDLFPRPPELDPAIEWFQQDLERIRDNLEGWRKP